MLRIFRSPLIPVSCALALYGCNKRAERDVAAGAPGQGSSATSSRASDTLTFHVIGTEHFWGLDLGPSGIRFTTPEDTFGIRFPPVAADASGDTLHWMASVERATLDARVWPGTCSDGMSDRAWPYHATVHVDTIAYHGCAETRIPERR